MQDEKDLKNAVVKTEEIDENKKPAPVKPLVKTSMTQLAVQTRGNLERQEAVSANVLIANDHVYTDALTRFARYIDSKGKQATSPGGMKTQVNKRIKAGYGVDRDHMTGMMRQHCAVLFAAITEVLNQGMDSHLTRTDIKNKTWGILELFVKQWQEINNEVYN